MKIQENVSLAPFTTLGVGGSARYFCVASSLHELKEGVRFANKNRLTVFVLGGGSNVLISDEGFSGLVLKLDFLGTHFHNIGNGFVRLVACAGESWDGIVSFSVRRRLWGIENMSGIPGSVGAAPIQNIGCYGQQLSDVVEWVEVFDTSSISLSLFRINKSGCGFRYRDSLFKGKKGKGFIVTRISLILSINSSPNLSYGDIKKSLAQDTSTYLSPRKMRETVLSIRSKKFPDVSGRGTAGSFFKNPVIPVRHYKELKKEYTEMPGYPEKNGFVKVPLAWILDHVCGLKGYREGGVGLYKNQPLVLVNYGSATSKHIKNFAEKIEHIVKEKTQIVIEKEVKIIA